MENVKILGGRVINDDGIDICRARDVTIRNSFVRSQDDCITPKYWCENLVVTNCTLWTDAANAFRAGFDFSIVLDARGWGADARRCPAWIHFAAEDRPLWPDMTPLRDPRLNLGNVHPCDYGRIVR